MTRIAILGASVGVVKSARSLGCELVLVQQPGFPIEKISRRGELSYIYSVDFTTDGFQTFVDCILKPLGVDAVVSVTEDGLLPAARANEWLGLPGTPSDVSARFRDKIGMRERLQSVAPEISVRFHSPQDGKDAAAIAASWNSIGRAILKPRASSGSRGIELVTAHELAGRTDLSQSVLEEYISGQEYSAESFSINGKHEVFAVTEKYVDRNFIEIAHVSPPTSLNGSDLERVSQDISLFLNAMGLENGPAHTEFKLGPDGRIRVIESHDRVGGDGIPRLVKSTTGADLKSWALGWPVGLGEPTGLEESVAPAAAVAFKTAEPGTVTSIRVPESPAPNFCWCDVEPGATVKALAASADRVGGAFAVGSTPGEALQLARKLAGDVEVRTVRNESAD